MSETQRNGKLMRGILLGVSACVLLAACGKANQRQSSSSSHWLSCETFADCPADRGAVACSLEGYCVDAAGERLSSETGSETQTELALAQIELAVDVPERRLDMSSLAERELRRKCGSCHVGAYDSEGLILLDFADLEALDHFGIEEEFVPLLKHLDEGTMPPPGAEPPGGPGFSSLVRYLVETFDTEIGPSSCLASRVDLDAQLAAVVADLARLPAEDRGHQRYISVPRGLVERDVPCGVSDGALTRLLNGTSRSPRVYEPVVLGEEPSLRRIDLRELGWDVPVTRSAPGASAIFGNAWEAIVGSAPHAAPFVGPDIETLERETGTRHPLLPVADLLTSLSDGWTYYAVLGIPSQSEALMAWLGVSGDPNLPAPGVLRAASSRAAVPGMHTLVERRPTSGGGHVWRAFYGAPDADGASPATRPVGHTATETHVSFSLPNGFPAWVIVGPQGEVVPKSAFAYPPLSMAGYSDNRLFAGPEGITIDGPLSCNIVCHEPENLYTVADQVRPGLERSSVGYSAELLDQLRELYVEPAVFEAQLVEDLGQVRQAQRVLESPWSFGVFPLTQVLLRRVRYPELQLSEAAEALGTTAARAAQALELGLDASDFVIEASTTLDGSRFDAQFPATLCRVHAGSRNRPTADYCAGR